VKVFLLWEQGVPGSNPGTPTKSPHNCEGFFIYMPFHLYILESQSSGKLYIGQTNNLSDRVERHNSGRNKYTKGKGPWILLFSISFETRSEAVLLEIRLKAWKNPVKVKEWIKTQID